MIRSVLLVTLGIAITAFFSFWSVVFSFFANSENNIHKVARIWGSILLRISNTKVHVIGPENVLRGKPQIFMANHQSDFDILIALAYIPGQFRWIAKKELFAIPVFGQAMKGAGYIEIDRQNHEKAMQSLDLAALRIREGKSVMTFPEGTRSRDGNLAPFNKGVFTIARYCNAPLKLILIKGTNKLFQPGHFLFNTHDYSEIQLELIGSLEPNYKNNNFSISALADEARKIFEEKIAKTMNPEIKRLNNGG